MPVTVKDINVYLSGGAGNSDPDASLGGIKSSTVVLSQAVTGLSAITGVAMVDAAGNAEGSGSLFFDFSATTLTWTPPSGAQGSPVTVSSDGTYIIRGAESASGYLKVTVTAASLPGSDQTDALTVAEQDNKIFDDVTSDEAFDGDINYRCIYVFNDHATDSMYQVVVWVDQDTPGADNIYIGLDAAGVGDGASTGVATTVVDENTAPGSVSFTQPTSETGGLSIGTLPAGEGHAIWIRRTVPPATLVDTPDNDFILRFRVLDAA